MIKADLLDEAHELLEVFGLFSWMSHDDRGSEVNAGDHLSRVSEDLTKQISSMAPLHQLQHTVTGVLNRHVEVGNDLRCLGNDRHDLTPSLLWDIGRGQRFHRKGYVK